MIVVNFFGAPGAGKSSHSAYLFFLLKKGGYNAELVTEFAKDKVWEESKAVFDNQAYIFGKQYFRLSRLKDKVEVAVTDSPLLLSPFYNKQPELGEYFNKMCLEVFNSFQNVNVFLNRVKPYNPVGRFQTEAESDGLVAPMMEMLADFGVEYLIYPGNEDSVQAIYHKVSHMLEDERNKKIMDNKD